MSVRHQRRGRVEMHDGHSVNETIRDERMTVIGDDGTNYGTVGRQQALDLAAERGLDLVKVGEKDGVAVTKIMDFGKFLYEKKKKQLKSKKSHKTIQIKEIKMRPKIGPGDYEIKIKAAVKFLGEGKRVKFTLQFRGRQPVSVEEVGSKFFNRIEVDLGSKDLGPLVWEKETRSRFMWSKICFVKGK